MAIIRTAQRDNFTVVPNATINDERLRWRTLGLLVYLLSKPGDWHVSAKHLARERDIGRDSVYDALRELTEAGYIQRRRLRATRGQVGEMEYVVFDRPVTENQEQAAPVTAQPDPAQPDPALPDRANQDAYKERSSTKNGEVQRTECESARAKSEPQDDGSGRTPWNQRQAIAGDLEPIPADFEPDSNTLARCHMAGTPKPTPAHVQGFIAHHQSTGMMLADWQPRFVKWMIGERSRMTGTRKASGRDRAEERRRRFGD